MAMTKTADANGLVDMAWDPITRIVGSLGIYTKIDFGKGKVAECQSTSSIFRGYSIFMKGKDPRDAHFITSRICGICGDNHAVCSCYAQQMAYGVRPPNLGEWIVNLGEAAEYMFDHNIFQENLVGVDYCEKMVAETNPGVLEQANRTEAPHAEAHGYKTIGDIMRSLNPFSGEFYREALQVSRYTREMFCLMEGRHVHPSTLYPGGVGTTATIQLFTDYITRLMRYVEFMKKVVPMHDDLFDFIYEAMPGYEMNGFRRTLLGCWGAFQDPDVCNFEYKDMAEWGRAMYVTPGVVVDGKLVTNSLVDINLGIRILLGSSYYDDWEEPGDVRRPGPAREPGRPPAPVEPAHEPAAPEARLLRQVQLGHVAPVVRRHRPPRPRHRRRAASPACGRPRCRASSNTDELKATGHSVEIHLPKTALKPEVTFEWKIPQWSNTIERNRARTYFQAYAAAAALHFARKALEEIRAGHTKTWQEFKVPDEAHRLRVHRGGARRALASHGDQEGQDRQLPPVPADPVEREPHRQLRHARPLRGRRDEHADLRGELDRRLQGHRHHAGGPQLRPVPAVRRPHVPRQRQGAAQGALADDAA